MSEVSKSWAELLFLRELTVVSCEVIVFELIEQYCQFCSNEFLLVLIGVDVLIKGHHYWHRKQQKHGAVITCDRKRLAKSDR